MKASPTITFEEFSQDAEQFIDPFGFHSTNRKHADFGEWKERSLDLGHIRIFEHKANLHQDVNVWFGADNLKKYVHHCMSVEGHLSANFVDCNLSANLSPRSFHNVYLPGDEYYLGMESKFHNVHVEVERDYYLDLLCDSESWSAKIKEKVIRDNVYYPGEFRLNQTMVETIYAIFSSTLSGSLKKLLIEAKVQELIALQLHETSAIVSKERVDKRHLELFHDIKSFLDATFLEDHSLKGISRHFGINEFTLKKGFKDNFQLTVFEYLLNKRMEWSLQLLQDTNQTIAEISGVVGYKYPNHFSTAFKKHFGYKPTKWRAAS